MRTLISNPHHVEWTQAPEPVLHPGEVLLKPLAVGVCGSDIHVFEGQHPFVSYPVFPGHEVAARVVEVGSGVDASWQGALVALEPSITCGRCEQCRSGRYNICEKLRVMGFQAPGAMAELFVSPIQNLHHLPEGFDAELGAMIEPLAVAVHAVALTQVQGKKVAVLGAGTIGLLVAQVARAYGAASVEIVDLLEPRRRVAEQLGLQAKSPDAAKYEVIFECVGNEKALEAAIQGIRKGGVIIVVGVYGWPATISAGLIQDWEIGLKGSLMYTFPDYQEAIRLFAGGQVQGKALITHRFALPEVRQAFHAALEREKALKVMLLAS
jgi:L-iditol 2-dehydrogenase